MKRFAILVVLAWLIPAPALAQNAQPPAPPPQPPPSSRLWFVVGGASTTLRGHCQECGQDFPFRHGGSVTGNAGYRVNSRTDVGADVFWVQWSNESGHITGTALNAIGQFRPWESQGFFIKGGAGMAFVRNFVPTAGPEVDKQKALSVMFGGGWEFRTRSRFGLQLFAMQHVGAIGDLQTIAGTIPDVTANFWSLGAAIVIR